MRYNHFNVTPAEMRRLREIANGDTKPANTPAEDALFKRHLIQEKMLILDNSDGTYSADMRGVLLTEQGEIYWSQHLRERKETRRFWIGTASAIIGILLTALGIAISLI